MDAAMSVEMLGKLLENGPLSAIALVFVWFLIFQVWPWYQRETTNRVKFEQEYKTSWLKTAQIQADRMEALVHEFEDMRHDLNAVLMLLARDKPELIEFFKARERRKGAG